MHIYIYNFIHLAAEFILTFVFYGQEVHDHVCVVKSHRLPNLQKLRLKVFC